MPTQTGRLIPQAASDLSLNNFDAVRLGLALLVVWSHSFALWFGSESGEPVSILTAGTYNSGNLAVLGFFVISGFLITLSFEKAKSPVRFLRNRIRRIYPGYIVATTLCSLVVVPLFSSRSLIYGLTDNEIVGILSNFWLRNYIIHSDAFAGKAVNGSLWSIPYEFWCYLGVLGLGLLGLLRRRWVYPLIAIGVMLVRVWLDATGRRPGGGFVGEIIGFPYFWFMVLPPFALGGAAYVWRAHIPRNGVLAAALIGLILMTAHVPLDYAIKTAALRLMIPPTLTYTILYACFNSSVKLHNAARFGDFSYGTYLYAFPIQQMLAWELHGKIGFGTYLCLSLALSLMAGIVSWHLVERWFLPRARHSSLRSRKGPAPLTEEAALVAP